MKKGLNEIPSLLLRRKMKYYNIKRLSKLNKHSLTRFFGGQFLGKSKYTLRISFPFS